MGKLARFHWALLLLLFPVATKRASSEEAAAEERTCGKTFVHNFPYPPDQRFRAPWSAIVFIRSHAAANGQYVSWIGATIIGDRTILVPGHPFWDDHSASPRQRRRRFLPQNLLVGVGLENRKSFTLPDEFTQFLEVDHVRPHPKSFIKNSDHDFALIRLKQRIEFGTKVLPLCVNISMETFWLSQQPLRLSGYRHDKNYSLVATYHDGNCANSNASPRLWVGSSLAAWNGGHWHLVGIVTGASRCGQGGQGWNHSIAALGNVEENLEWFSGGNSVVAENSSNCGRATGLLFEGACTPWTDTAVLKVSSGTDGSFVTIPRRSSSNSVNESRETEDSRVRAVSCPPIRETPGILVQCTSSDILIIPYAGAGSTNSNCTSAPSPLGSRAFLRCSKHYKAVGTSSFAALQCDSKGEWTQNQEGGAGSFDCVPECGLPRPAQVSSFIINGSRAVGSSWPWNGALFRTDTASSEPKYICGLTLITPSHLVTAAHCLHQQADGQRTEPGALLVVLAPSSSNFHDNQRFSQVIRVSSVHVPELYNPATYEADIGIVKLAHPARISDHVYPVCFPFPGRENERIELYQTSPGGEGVVVGFGASEPGNAQPSPTLKKAVLPVVSIRECVRVLDILPTASQLCVGVTTGTTVCNGDSGAGYYVQEAGVRGLYFIQGVVSHGKIDESTGFCNANQYAIFTKVGTFKHWVEKIVKL